MANVSVLNYNDSGRYLCNRSSWNDGLVSVQAFVSFPDFCSASMRLVTIIPSKRDETSKHSSNNVIFVTLKLDGKNLCFGLICPSHITHCTMSSQWLWWFNVLPLVTETLYIADFIQHSWKHETSKKLALTRWCQCCTTWHDSITANLPLVRFYAFGTLRPWFATCLYMCTFCRCPHRWIHGYVMIYKREIYIYIYINVWIALHAFRSDTPFHQCFPPAISG